MALGFVQPSTIFYTTSPQLVLPDRRERTFKTQRSNVLSRAHRSAASSPCPTLPVFDAIFRDNIEVLWCLVLVAQEAQPNRFTAMTSPRSGGLSSISRSSFGYYVVLPVVECNYSSREILLVTATNLSRYILHAGETFNILSTASRVHPVSQHGLALLWQFSSKVLLRRTISPRISINYFAVLLPIQGPWMMNTLEDWMVFVVHRTTRFFRFCLDISLMPQRFFASIHWLIMVNLTFQLSSSGPQSNPPPVNTYSNQACLHTTQTQSFCRRRYCTTAVLLPYYCTGPSGSIRGSQGAGPRGMSATIYQNPCNDPQS